MPWIIFAGLAWLITLLLVPFRNWKKLWPVGIFTIILLFFIDHTLSNLGAFQYKAANINFFDLPVFFLLSSFPGGILLTYLFPKDRYKILYILIATFIFLIMEWIMMAVGAFVHLDWNLLQSYILNLIGFTVVLGFAEWSGLTKNSNNYLFN